MQQLLYDKFASKMYGVCLRYAANAEEAKDLLQDGFVKIFSRMESYRGDGSFEGWVRRIFVNTAIEQVRKKNYLIQPITEREEETIDNGQNSVLEILEANDLVKLLQELPIGYRTVFNMYYVEEYTHKEIAEILDISEGTSKSQLSRAKTRLRELAAEYRIKK